MIPKVIHYCWFGGKPLPKDAERCILSWKKYMPEYEIRRWDETSFDVDSIPYTKEAYAAGKYAFVSDYARFWILYNHGGLYFDTDVEVVKPLDDIVQAGPFLGVEQQTDECITVAPGLCIGAEIHNDLFKVLIAKYEESHFLNPDGSFCMKNVVEITTEVLLGYGLINIGEIQTCCGFPIYPKEYFCPIDYDTRELKITENTRTIHHYAESWLPKSTKFKNALARMFGQGFLKMLVKIKHWLKKS
jgi:mannosyltransferase OCH1-like enzyme